MSVNRLCRCRRLMACYRPGGVRQVVLLLVVVCLLLINFQRIEVHRLGSKIQSQEVASTTQVLNNTGVLDFHSKTVRSWSLMDSMTPTLSAKPEVSRTLPLTGSGIVSLMDTKVQLYSVIGRNSSKTGYWDHLALIGWESKTNQEKKYTCCLKYSNNTEIASAPMIEKINWSYLGKAKFAAKQFVCPNIKSNVHLLPSGVTLVLKGQKCVANDSLYLKPEFPHRAPLGSISVCTKLAFGTLRASSIIEWFEVHKRMGVQKVITYTSNLNADAMKVLRHYQSEGIGELHPFTLPDKDGVTRDLGTKNFQGWNDEQVPLFDCEARLWGYTYIGLIDLDEYVTPKRYDNWSGMLNQLRKETPAAAGFTFNTEIYPSTWGKMDNTTDIQVAAYHNRTLPMKDRVKSIVMPARIMAGHLSTHGYWVRKGYQFKKRMVPADIATLKHYRACRKEWLRRDGSKCYKDIERVTDKSMVNVAKLVEKEIHRIKEVLNIQR